MELVFVHGWGFDASFWDELAPLLSEFPQRRVDRGYFGEIDDTLATDKPAILIGHSLGFVHGIQNRKNWAGWVAINSFTRFVQATDGRGCVSLAALRDMRMRLAADPAATLVSFYKLIGATPQNDQAPNAQRLYEGLDELKNANIGDALASLAVPGLTLAALDDPLVPRSASEALAAKSRKAWLIWQKTGGHLLPKTHTEWCAQQIKEFLAII